MNTRPVAASFFVVFCLLLCGLILRRQIAAHPLPPDTRAQGSQEWDFQKWRPAAPSVTAQVRGSVQAELDALRAGNAPAAAALQSRFLRRRFSSPDEFLRLISFRHPELARFRAVRYGLVWADPTGQNARAALRIEGADGVRTPEDFLLVREGGRFKISHFRLPVPQ